jgi:integrase
MVSETSEAKDGVESKRNGTKTGQTSAVRPTKTLARSHVDYWKSRIQRRAGVGNGLYYVRLRKGGGDSWFCLRTANLHEAASRALDLWKRSNVISLDALKSEYDPAPPKRSEVGTVGEAIEAARPLSTVRPLSFNNYVKRLRQIAAEIGQVPRPSKPTSPRSTANEEWRERIDAVPLSLFSQENVNAWRSARINAAGNNPAKRRAAGITADAVVRMARSIFGADFLAAGLRKHVALPSPLPFAGCKWGISYRRYKGTVDPVRLFAAARTELSKAHPQQFLAFCICLLAGLRKSEADRLTWEQVNFDGGLISIRDTDHFVPKSEESQRVIELDDPAVEILRRAKLDDPDPVFVLKGSGTPMNYAAAPSYRADAAPFYTWSRLLRWLRDHGVREVNAVHALRKMAGSLVFEEHGIEQAREMLGHSDIGVTSRHYVAKSKRVVINLDPPPDDVANERGASR